jgi:glycosyltransferase involved in cell wall biosynthesis
VVLLGAFNQMLAPAAWALAQARGLPLVVDYLTGLLDAAEDRGTVPAGRRALLQAVDRFAIRRAVTLTDTAAHRDAFGAALGVNVHRMAVLPVGARDLDPLPPPDANAPLVQYVGTYIPFHGVDVILEAARRLPGVPFELIGAGQTHARTLALARDLGLANVRFVTGYFPKHELIAMQARSTIVLGVFGDAPKTRQVVPNKVYEALAQGRPLVTAESAALAEMFTPGQHLLTVPPGDADALAAALRALLDDPAQRARRSRLPAAAHRRAAQSAAGNAGVSASGSQDTGYDSGGTHDGAAQRRANT